MYGKRSSLVVWVIDVKPVSRQGSPCPFVFFFHLIYDFINQQNLLPHRRFSPHHLARVQLGLNGGGDLRSNILPLDVAQ
jgi:hypothetical protein